MKKALLTTLALLALSGMAFAHYCPSDLNGDGLADEADLEIISSEMGRTDCLQEGCQGDLNNDGSVNLRDIQVFRENMKKPECYQGK